MAARALNNNKEDQDHDEKDVDTTEGASANHEVTHGELYQQEINNCTGPVVNQVMKWCFTAETKNIYLHGLSSLLMGPVWLFISFK